MRRPVLLLLISCLAITSLKAQDESAEAPYKRFPTVPPFNLLSIDSSTHITKDDLHRHTKTLIMYFSPDCDHCQHQTKEMLAKMDKFKGIQIIMATYQPFEEMVTFYKEYGLANYSNIKIGRDTKFFFVPYYHINNLPYLALYDVKGNLIKTFEGTTPVDKLVNNFKKKAKK